MSRLTQDRTTKPVSRDQILKRERRQGNIHSLCSADHEQQVWQSYPVGPYSVDFTYMLYLYIQQQRYICIIQHQQRYICIIQHQQHCNHPPSFRPMRTSTYNKSVPERPGNTMNPALIKKFQFFCESEHPKKHRLQVLHKIHTMFTVALVPSVFCYLTYPGYSVVQPLFGQAGVLLENWV